MGSGELVYGSDLDVIFVCDPGGFCTAKDDRSGEEFWTRVAQRVVEILQQRQSYEVDTRLRPWGKQGPMVVNFNSLRGYWEEPRDIWERLAMTRIAPIAGDPSLGHEASELVRNAALASPLPEDSTEMVAQMRARMQNEQGSPNHVKHGPGGYVDAEFVAQYFSLGRDPDDVPPGAAIEHILLALSSAKVIPLDAAFELAEALRLLRRIEARLRLWRGNSESSLPTDEIERLHVAERCGFESGPAFDAAVEDARISSRRWFVDLIGPLPESNA
jgi:glutamate-ammonia-ligase adenylyltransferase